MLEKISLILIILTAGMAFAIMDIKPLRTHSALISPTVVCWPDEDARTCWRRAEHRLAQR